MSFQKKLSLLAIPIALALPSFANAFTFEGYLSDASNVPITTTVTLRLKVKSPGAESCLLYDESHSVTPDADGYVSVKIGAGTRIDGLGHTVDRAFANYGSFSGLTCSSGTTYAPATGASRKLEVIADSVSLGLLDMTPVPVAMSSEKIANFGVNNLLRVETAGTPGSATAFTSAQFSDLNSLIAGTSSKYMQSSGTTAGAALPVVSGSPSTPVAGSLWYDSVSNQIKYYNGSVQTIGAGGGGSVNSVTGTAPITVTGSTSVDVSIAQATSGASGYLSSADWNTFNNKIGSGTAFSGDVTGFYSSLTLANSGVSAGSYTKVTVDSKGRVTAGLSVTSTDVTTALGYIPLSKTGGTLSGVLGLYAISSDPSTGGWTTVEAGRAWYNTSSNNIKYWDGASVQALGTAGAGITSFNGLTSSAQTLVVSFDNTIGYPDLSSAGAIHSIRFPMAFATGVNAGLISKTDYDMFNSKLGPGTPFSGDVSGTIAAISVDRIKGYPLNISSPVSGDIIKYDGTAWVNSASAGISGGGFSNTISAGGTGATSFTANSIVGMNGTGSSMVSVSCGLNQVIGFDASGFAGCYSVASLYNGLSLGGNSASADLTVGTNSAYGFHLRTNGLDRVSINPSGNVGIGNNTPASMLDVNGEITSRPYGVSTGQTGQIKLRELASDGTNVVSLRAPDALSSDLVFTLPNLDGINGQVLTTNGAGVLGWASKGDILQGGNNFAVAMNIGTNDAFGLNLKTNGSTRVTIGQSGFVGIGTIAPATALDVQHSAPSGFGISVKNSDTIGRSGISFYDSSSSLQGYVAFNNSSASPANTMVLSSMNANPVVFSTSNLERLRIDGSNGNIGIGTTSPAASLDVHGAVAAKMFTALPGSSAGQGGAIQLRELNSYGTNSVVLKSPDSLSADVVMTLPSNSPNPGDVLTAMDGSGTLQWQSGGGSETTLSATNTVGFGSYDSVFLTSPSGTSITLNGMNIGRKYLLSITHSTSNTYTFTSSMCSSFKYSPANVATTANVERIYEIYVRGNNLCYIKWADYQ